MQTESATPVAAVAPTGPSATAGVPRRGAARDLGLALAGGVLTALSVPPFGWWVLGPVGLAVLCRLLGDRPARSRAALGIAFGLGLYGVGLGWVKQFSLPGAAIFAAFVAVQTGIVFVLVPPGRGRWVGFPAVVVGAEAFRGLWPFGGLPLSGIDLGQSGGPLAPLVGIGGRLLLVGAAATLGVALASLARGPRRPLVAVVALGSVAALTTAAWLAPAGHEVGRLRVAVVQGGGRRGVRAQNADMAAVFAAHLDASSRITPPVDLVLWPEDVVDVTILDGSPEEAALAGLARRLHATVVAGIVEDAGPRHFHNSAVAWGPDGRIVARYQKVHRVPFGEYFPFRSILERLAAIPASDAIPGPHRPGFLATPAGQFGVVVSYEVFFQGRARSAVGAGGELLLVPTNAASFTTGQMPSQELAGARLRAWQTGRDVLQASPTGFSAVLNSRGRVRSHTDLGARQVLQATVALRRGDTPYGRTGDTPLVGAVAALLVAAWWVERRPGPRARPART